MAPPPSKPDYNVWDVDPALDLRWARDPFDRLLVAHARLRGWRLATADAALLGHWSDRERVEI